MSFFDKAKPREDYRPPGTLATPSPSFHDLMTAEENWKKLQETFNPVKKKESGYLEFKVEMQNPFKYIYFDTETVSNPVPKPSQVDDHTKPNWNQNLIAAITAVDISKFPIKFRIEHVANTSLSAGYYAKFGITHGFILWAIVKDSTGMKPDNIPIEVATPWEVPLEDDFETCVEHIRKACQHFILHELDEFFRVHGELPYNPHTSEYRKTKPIKYPGIRDYWTGLTFKNWVHQDLKNENFT